MAIVYFRKIVFGTQDPPIDSVIFCLLKIKYGSLVTKNSAQEARHQGLMELDLKGERFQSSETNELVKQQHVSFPVKDLRFIRRRICGL